MRSPDRKLDYLFFIGYVALVYGMLSITPMITKPVERGYPSLFGIFGNIAVVLFILLALAVFKHRLKGKSPATLAGIAAILLIYAFLLIYETPIAVEKLHLIEYGFMTYLALRVVRNVRPTDLKYLIVILTVTLIGIGDELMQEVIPIRVCDVRDMLMNSLAGLLALVLLILLDER